MYSYLARLATDNTSMELHCDEPKINMEKLNILVRFSYNKKEQIVQSSYLTYTAPVTTTKTEMTTNQKNYVELMMDEIVKKFSMSYKIKKSDNEPMVRLKFNDNSGTYGKFEDFLRFISKKYDSKIELRVIDGALVYCVCIKI